MLCSHQTVIIRISLFTLCSVQSLSRVWLFATPWTAARQYVAKMQIIQNLGNISLPRMVLGFSLSNAGSHHSFNLPPDSKKWPLRTDLLWPHAKAGQVQRPWHQGTQIASKIYIWWHKIASALRVGLMPHGLCVPHNREHTPSHRSNTSWFLLTFLWLGMWQTSF